MGKAGRGVIEKKQEKGVFYFFVSNRGIIFLEFFRTTSNYKLEQVRWEESEEFLNYHSGKLVEICGLNSLFHIFFKICILWSKKNHRIVWTGRDLVRSPAPLQWSETPMVRSSYSEPWPDWPGLGKIRLWLRTLL